MNETVIFALQWYGAIAGLLAAAIVSFNISTRASGWGFVLFVTSSMALIAWAFLGDKGLAVGWQNIGLFVINCIGVYRYLIEPAGKSDAEADQ